MANKSLWNQVGQAMGDLLKNGDEETLAEIRKILGEIKEILKPFDGLGKERPGKLFLTMKDAVVEGNNISKKYLAKIADAVVEGSASATPIKPSPVKNATVSDKKTSDSGVGSLLKSIAGPVKDIATALLIVATAAALMSVAGVGPAMALTLVAVFAALLLMITGMVVLTNYAAKTKVLDPKNKDGIIPVINMLKQVCIAILVLILVGSIVMMGGWKLIAIGLLTVFITLASTIFEILAISKIMHKLLGDPKNPKPGTPFAFIKGIVLLVLAIVLIAIVCAIFQPLIMKGLFLATSIFLGVSLLALFLVNTLGAIKKDTLDGITGVLMKIVILIAVMGIIVLILGIMPIGWVMQGMVILALLVGLNNVLFYGIKMMIDAMKGVDAAKIEEIKWLMLSFIIMLVVMSVLVIALGSIDTGTLIQGAIALVLIVAMIVLAFVVGTELLSKIKVSMLVKGLIGLAIVTVFALAITLVGVLILAIMGDSDAVLTAAKTLLMLTLALIVVGLAMILFVTIGAVFCSPFGWVALGLALLGLAVIVLFTLAIVAVGILLVAAASTGSDPSEIEEACKNVMAITKVILKAIIPTILEVVAFASVAILAVIAALIVISLLVFVDSLAKFVTSFMEIDWTVPNDIDKAMSKIWLLLVTISVGVLITSLLAVLLPLIPISILYIVGIWVFVALLQTFVAYMQSHVWTLEADLEKNLSRAFDVLKLIGKKSAELADTDIPGVFGMMSLLSIFAKSRAILSELASFAQFVKLVDWSVFNELPEHIQNAMDSVALLNKGVMRLAAMKMPGLKEIIKLRLGFSALSEIVDSMSILADKDANIFNLIYDNIIKFAELTPAIDNMFRFAEGLNAICDSFERLQEKGFGMGNFGFMGSLKTISNLVVEFGTVNKLQEAIDNLLAATVAFKEAVKYLIAQGPSGFVSTVSTTGINSFDDGADEPDAFVGEANFSEAIDGDMEKNGGGNEIESQRIQSISIQSDIRQSMWTQNYLMRKLIEYVEKIEKNTEPEKEKGFFGWL